MHRPFAPLALCDRAYEFLLAHGAVSEEELLIHVFGGPAPATVRDTLAAPLRNDARLERREDGLWRLRGVPARDDHAPLTAFTALALAASGPSPTRARLVRIAAVHVEAGQA